MAPEMNASDWSASYSQYLARAAAISTRTLSLYQLALERVSQGKLPATIFQDHFVTFSVTHGPEFMNRFAEVGSRFLSDLVRLSSSFSQQSPIGAPLATAQEDVPPEFDTSNPARWYEQMAEYAGQLNARALRTYRAQLDRVAAGEMTPSEVQQRAADQMAQQLPNYMQVLTQLYFDLLNGLNEVRSAYEETYFRGLLARTRPDDDEGKVTLTLRGPVSTTATASLAITNTTRVRTQIGHQVVDVRRVDGVGPSFVAPITFVPEKLELEPGEEATLAISLLLDSEQYAADAWYNGTLSLTGAGEVPLEADLRILASAASTHPNGQGSV
jgi:hypothetical protein